MVLLEYYIISTIFLATAIWFWNRIRQPAQRLALGKAVIVVLLFTGVLLASPRLPRFAVFRKHVTAQSVSPQFEMPIIPIANSPEEISVTLPIDTTSPIRTTQIRAAHAVSGPNIQLPSTTLLLGIHLLFSAALLVRLLVGTALALRVRAKSTPLATERNVSISRQITAPVVLGFRHPVILLPEAFCRTENAESVRLALVHEREHLENGDLRTVFYGRLLQILLPLQPLVGLLMRRVRQEQEILADAAVLRNLSDGQAAEQKAEREKYAEKLLAWTKTAKRKPRLAAAQAIGLWEFQATNNMIDTTSLSTTTGRYQMNELTRRVNTILDESQQIVRKSSRRWNRTLAACLILAALAFSGITLQPKIVISEEPAGEPQTVSPEFPKPDVVPKNNDVVADATKRMIVTPTTVNPFDPKTYSEKFAEHVAKIEKSVQENNGMALFVRLVDAEGKPVSRVDYHVASRCHVMGNFPCGTWDGWFGTFNVINPAMRQLAEKHGIPDEYKTADFFVYTATHTPVTIEIPVALGTIYYADVKLEKTPEDELTSLSGTVLGENDEPLDGVTVHLRVLGGRGATSSLMQTNTDKAGRFSFDKVTPQPYQIALNKQGYPYTELLPGISLEKLGEEHVCRYFKPRAVEIEYVFQPDGSRDFTKGDLQSHSVTLDSDFSKGFRFKNGELTNAARDIDFRNRNGELLFAQVYFRNENGFYDAGEVPFDSVTEADEKADVYPNVDEDGYQKPRPVELNHVYVVKTTDGEYAKFIVRKIIVKQ